LKGKHALRKRKNKKTQTKNGDREKNCQKHLRRKQVADRMKTISIPDSLKAQPNRN